MQLFHNRADWERWVAGLAGVSVRFHYNVPAEPSHYPCFGYAVMDSFEPGYEAESPRYLYAADVCSMAATLLGRVA
ncbi:hypothetical protein [Pseudomonas sp. PS02288]|uniref:hypothetical protein n=1 Tax=Pseudomonas sp. PS02288 TaxID=2991443 RepID=UPI00249C3A12|nr:hypothetical protein [Pseudomonas sp. PS02288]